MVNIYLFTIRAVPECCRKQTQLSLGNTWMNAKPNCFRKPYNKEGLMAEVTKEVTIRLSHDEVVEAVKAYCADLHGGDLPTMRGFKFVDSNVPAEFQERIKITCIAQS